MADILKIFSKKAVLNYVQNRQYPTYLGDGLFTPNKVQSLEVELLQAGSMIPTIAPMSAFDTEAEMGSREAKIGNAELGYIKRKMQLKEKDLVALRNPRDPQEEDYLKKRVYNDLDFLVNGVHSRIELMRMQLLTTGVVTAEADGIDFKVDYHIPTEHKVTPTKTWDDAASDPIADMLAWVDLLDFTPSYVLTSSKVKTALLNNDSIQELFKRRGMIGSLGDLNSLLSAYGLPIIATYDAKYKKEDKKTGKKTSYRYFPEEAFVMFGEEGSGVPVIGETLYGPTPEESRLLASNVDNLSVGNIWAEMWEEGHDPVGTFTKAASTALPTLADTDNIIQATVLAASK